MKKISIVLLSAAVSLVAGACRNRPPEDPKPSAPAKAPSERISTVNTLEGQQVQRLSTSVRGVEEAEGLSSDGRSIIRTPYVWFSGRGIADNLQAAIEMAQREAYAAISRTVSAAVMDEAERGNVGNNGQVQQALTEHWKQFSNNVVKACSPYDTVTADFDQFTQKYVVVAKVAIVGTKYNELLNSAGSFTPTAISLTREEMKRFFDSNKAIMEASKVK